nr:hypothetical protein Iba_chr10eCG15130 [Ipomoea batatas]
MYCPGKVVKLNLQLQLNFRQVSSPFITSLPIKPKRFRVLNNEPSRRRQIPPHFVIPCPPNIPADKNK